VSDREDHIDIDCESNRVTMTVRRMWSAAWVILESIQICVAILGDASCSRVQ